MVSSDAAAWCICPCIFRKHKIIKSTCILHSSFCIFSIKQCIRKQLLYSVFVISRIIKVLASVFSLGFQPQLITVLLNLDYSDWISQKPYPIIVYNHYCLQSSYFYNFQCFLLLFCQVLQQFQLDTATEGCGSSTGK